MQRRQQGPKDPLFPQCRITVLVIASMWIGPDEELQTRLIGMKTTTAQR